MWGFGHAISWVFINFSAELQCRRVFRPFRKNIENLYFKMQYNPIPWGAYMKFIISTSSKNDKKGHELVIVPAFKSKNI